MSAVFITVWHHDGRPPFGKLTSSWLISLTSPVSSLGPQEGTPRHPWTGRGSGWLLLGPDGALGGQGRGRLAHQRRPGGRRFRGGDPPTSFLLGLLAAPCKERGVQLLRTASGTTARIRRRFSSPRKRTPLRFDQLAVLNKPLHTAPTHPHAPPPEGGVQRAGLSPHLRRLVNALADAMAGDFLTYAFDVWMTQYCLDPAAAVGVVGGGCEGVPPLFPGRGQAVRWSTGFRVL